MKRTIYLYGELAKKFGKSIVLKADSVYSAMSGLRANLPGFEKFLIEYQPGFHFRVGDVYRSELSVHDPIGSKDLHIIPAVSGSSGKIGAVFAIIIGILMIWNPMGWAILGTQLATSFAVGLIMAGVSALLFAPPKPQGPKEKPENTPNTYFNGPVNTIAQGHPVPIGYGELIIGSAVISAGLETVNI